MPRYKLIIQKQFGTEYWVNDYYFTATDLDDADSKAQPIIDAEIAVTCVGVVFDLYRISTVDPDDGIFRNYPLNVQGTKPNNAELLPLFVVLRVDFQADTGRAGRKYLRGVLGEADVQFNTLNSTSVDQYNTLYATPLRSLGYLEKSSGVLLNDVAINPTVAMRQLRRGSKRRVTPII